MLLVIVCSNVYQMQCIVNYQSIPIVLQQADKGWKLQNMVLKTLDTKVFIEMSDTVKYVDIHLRNVWWNRHLTRLHKLSLQQKTFIYLGNFVNLVFAIFAIFQSLGKCKSVKLELYSPEWECIFVCIYYQITEYIPLFISVLHIYIHHLLHFGISDISIY